MSQAGMSDERSVETKVHQFQATCREAGLRVTPQRVAVYRALLETDAHPSAETVFRQVRRIFPSISLDTVNRTLLTLSDIGAAFIVEGSGDAKRFDGNQDDHQHFKCIRCKRIMDFHHKPFDQMAAPPDLPAGYTVLRTTVYVEGLCDACSRDVD